MEVILKNLSQALTQFDDWLNSQMWLNSILGVIESMITKFTPDVKTARDACTYTLIGTIILAIVTALVWRDIASLINASIVVFACALILMRVLDGVVSMRQSSIFMLILDCVRIYFMLFAATEIFCALISLFNHAIFPIFICNTLTEWGFLLAVLLSKNVIDRSPI